MRRIPFLFVLYAVIGVVVAYSENYFDNVERTKQLLSAILAVALWPLVLVEGDTELSQGALERDYDLLVNLEETLGKEKVEEEWAAGREEGTAALDLESSQGDGSNGRRPARGPTSIVI